MQDDAQSRYSYDYDQHGNEGLFQRVEVKEFDATYAYTTSKKVIENPVLVDKTQSTNYCR